MSRHEGLIVGLDIGTTKICAVVAEENGDAIDIVGIGTHPSRGLRKGVVIDIDATVDSIRKAVDEAELMAGCDGVAFGGARRRGELRTAPVLALRLALAQRERGVSCALHRACPRGRVARAADACGARGPLARCVAGAAGAGSQPDGALHRGHAGRGRRRPLSPARSASRVARARRRHRTRPRGKRLPASSAAVSSWPV